MSTSFPLINNGVDGGDSRQIGQYMNTSSVDSYSGLLLPSLCNRLDPYKKGNDYVGLSSPSTMSVMRLRTKQRGGAVKYSSHTPHSKSLADLAAPRNRKLGKKHMSPEDYLGLMDQHALDFERELKQIEKLQMIIAKRQQDFLNNNSEFVEQYMAKKMQQATHAAVKIQARQRGIAGRSRVNSIRCAAKQQHVEPEQKIQSPKPMSPKAESKVASPKSIIMGAASPKSIVMGGASPKDEIIMGGASPKDEIVMGGLASPAEETVPSSPTESKKQSLPASKFKQNDRVEATMPDWDQHFPGRVRVVHGDGTLHIEFDDGDVVERVPEANVKLAATEPNKQSLPASNIPSKKPFTRRSAADYASDESANDIPEIADIPTIGASPAKKQMSIADEWKSKQSAQMDEDEDGDGLDDIFGFLEQKDEPEEEEDESDGDMFSKPVPRTSPIQASRFEGKADSDEDDDDDYEDNYDEAFSDEESKFAEEAKRQQNNDLNSFNAQQSISFQNDYDGFEDDLDCLEL